MPTCLVADKCNVPDLFRVLFPPAGHTLQSFRKDGGKLAALVPFAQPVGAPNRDDEKVARVYEYGGAARALLPKDKLILPRDEVAFVMNRFPGLLEVVDDSDGGDDTVAVLMGQRSILEKKVTEAEVLLNDAKRQGAAHRSASEAAQSQAQSLAVEREKLISENARLNTELADTKAALEALKKKQK